MAEIISEIVGSILTTSTAKRIASAQNQTNIDIANLGLQGDRIMASAQMYGWDVQKIIAEIQAASAQQVAEEEKATQQVNTAGQFLTAVQQKTAAEFVAQAGNEKIIWIGAMAVLVLFVLAMVYMRVFKSGKT